METKLASAPSARPDLRAGLFGLDPRTHLLAVVAFGVASIVLTGLLETALLQVAAALYLAGNGRARLALRSMRKLSPSSRASLPCRCRGCTGCCS